MLQNAGLKEANFLRGVRSILRYFLQTPPDDVIYDGYEDRAITGVFPTLGIVAGHVDERGVDALCNDPLVDQVWLGCEPELIFDHPSEMQVLSEDGWSLAEMEEFLKLRNLGLTGAGVRVVHIDTGIDVTHPAFVNSRITFAKFGSNGKQVEGAAARDSWGHGTHTAGIICGGDFDGSPLGVAPGVELYSAAVMGSKSKQRVLAALEWAIALNARVVNISLGVPGYTRAFERVFRHVRQYGILVVAAIGNSGPGSSTSPGNYPYSLSVGAINQSGFICGRLE